MQGVDRREIGPDSDVANIVDPDLVEDGRGDRPRIARREIVLAEASGLPHPTGDITLRNTR